MMKKKYLQVFQQYKNSPPGHHSQEGFVRLWNYASTLVVNYVHGTVADENGIRCSEALFYPTGEVHSLFNQNNRVGADLLGLFQYTVNTKQEKSLSTDGGFSFSGSIQEVIKLRE